MSILASLAYAIAAAVRPMVRDAEIAQLQAKVDDLRRDFDETLTRVERQRDEALALVERFDETLMRVERQRDEALALVERYQGRVDQQAPAGPVFGPVHHINEDMRQRMMAQAQAQQQMAHAQAQQGWAQQGWVQQGLAQYALQQGQQFGMQNFGQALDDYVRNCTPARHELFMRG